MIYPLGRTAHQISGEEKSARVVDFVGSGYSYNVEIVSLGWLASIAGVTGVDVKLEESQPIPPLVKPDVGLICLSLAAWRCRSLRSFLLFGIAVGVFAHY